MFGDGHMGTAVASGDHSTPREAELTSLRPLPSSTGTSTSMAAAGVDNFGDGGGSDGGCGGCGSGFDGG